MGLVLSAAACMVPDVTKAPPGCDLSAPSCAVEPNNPDPNKQNQDQTRGPSDQPVVAKQQTTHDAGSDAQSHATGPKPASCKSAADACFEANTDACGCNEDCCGTLICSKIGGLVENRCCVAAADACTSNNDCCGQALCKDDGTGKKTCQ